MIIMNMYMINLACAYLNVFLFPSFFSEWKAHYNLSFLHKWGKNIYLAIPKKNSFLLMLPPDFAIPFLHTVRTLYFFFRDFVFPILLFYKTDGVIFLVLLLILLLFNR